MKNRQEAKDSVTLKYHFSSQELYFLPRFDWVQLVIFFGVPFENRLAGTSWKSPEPGLKQTFWEYTTPRSWWKVARGD